MPTTKTKKPLFDQVKLTAQLSELSHHAHDPQNLPFTSLTFSKDHKTFTFNADSSKWEWELATETLKRLGPATPAAGGGRAWWRGGGGGAVHRRRRRRPIRRTPAAATAAWRRAGGGGGGGGGRGGGGGDFRNYSPDSSHVRLRARTQSVRREGRDEDTVQLTRDGAKDYSFGARDTLQERQQNELNRQQTADRTATTKSGGGGGGSDRSQNPAIRACAPTSRGRPTRRRSSVTRMDQRKVKRAVSSSTTRRTRVRR